MKLTGNTMLVTGGGSGIGQALAWQFADRSNEVIVAGRTRSSLEETIAGRPNMHALVLDVADQGSVSAAAEAMRADFPALNVLIHSAGIMRRDELTGDTEALSRQIIDINLMGTIRTVEAFMPLLTGNPDAAICTVSSGLAFAPLPMAPAYSASKAAVHNYTLSLRQRLKGQCEVIEIAPPAVQTGLTPGQETREGYLPLADYIAETMANFANEPDLRENLVKMVLPLRYAERDGKIDEVLEMLSSL